MWQLNVFCRIYTCCISSPDIQILTATSGHYSTHHTKIRCNKCFAEFERKTEKNAHQRSCSADVPTPSFEVIDCDKADEIEESLGIFRTWQLENEEDEAMKRWVLQYKLELANNGSDDAYNCRELAKWYRIWRTLYPSHQSPVPSPCKYTPKRLNRLLLTVFSPR